MREEEMMGCGPFQTSESVVCYIVRRLQGTRRYVTEENIKEVAKIFASD
jgi:NADH:ubiquinone oxidoreductase subunit E